MPVVHAKPFAVDSVRIINVDLLHRIIDIMLQSVILLFLHGRWCPIHSAPFIRLFIHSFYTRQRYVAAANPLPNRELLQQLTHCLDRETEQQLAQTSSPVSLCGPVLIHFHKSNMAYDKIFHRITWLMFKSGANKKNRNRWRCSFDHRCVKVHSQLLTTNMLQRHRAKPAIQCEGGISYMSRDLHEYT